MSRFIAITTIALFALWQPAAFASTKLDARIDTATDILYDLSRIPEQAIPPNLLNRAYAVAVIPAVVRAGVIMVGGSFGKGIVVVRQADGSWSNPAFISLGNVALGPQLGVQGADLILVFKSRRGVDQIAEGKLTIGGSVAASAGPVGRTAVAVTDGSFEAEIYTYARSRGLFAGISLDGGGIAMDASANLAYYGSGKNGAWQILNDATIPRSVAAQRFTDRLSAMAPRLQWKPEPATAPTSTPPVSEGAKTYAIEEKPAADAPPETLF